MSVVALPQRPAPSRRLPRGAHEADHQRALFEWKDHAQHAVGMAALALLHAVPNSGGYTGGYRANMLRAQSMKRQGVRPGVPDVDLPVARRGYIGCRIELKSATGRVSKDQRWWIRHLRHAGHCVAVCRSWDRARAVLEYYLGEADVVPAEVREAW